MSAKAIQRLDEAVVNRIAAGEVIQRPANAIKELLENCLDAKSTNIQITVKDGGLKMLQIQDNGTGIRREDMEIVCERFTTSKLEKFEDLGTISTYGFRGEALASITHIAHVTITTRTSDSKCAYKGSYIDGKLKDSVKPCAGNTGTLISVEDLFFNVPTRRRALKSATEEHQKISEVVSKYAIHNSSVGFTLKKQGDGGNTDVKTLPSSSHIDNIRIIYGATIARELLELSLCDERLSFKAHGYVSNANYSTKKPTFILFINHRLVDSTSLRRAIDSVYSAYLPKQTHPFVYLSLEINPRNVDVNVHPTKHEVHFLHEEAVIEAVQKAVDSRLLGSNSSRTFYIQNMLPSATAVVPAKDLLDTVKSTCSTSVSDNKVTANHMVRTDSRERKLDAFLSRIDKSQTPGQTMEKDSGSAISFGNHSSVETAIDGIKRKSNPELKGISSTNSSDTGEGKQKIEFQTRRRCNVRLTSVLSLRDDVDADAHSGLRLVIADHTFCGIVSPELALIQHQTKLYLANTTRLSREFFYQRILNEFGNMGLMRLSEKAPLYDLAMLALESPGSGWVESDGSREELAQFAVQLLVSKADMLRQYFSIDIDSEGNLTSLPLLLDKYIPALEGLPMYVLRLATEVEWDSERECFETFASETATFFAVSNEWLLKDEEEAENSAADQNISMDVSQSYDINTSQSLNQSVAVSSQINESFPSQMPSMQDSTVDELPNLLDPGEKSTESKGAGGKSSGENWKWMIEHVLYPAMRSELFPPKRFSEDGTLLQIANLPDLYKVFERC